MKYPVEYIWIDAHLQIRSKTKIVAEHKTFDVWNYDGSSTGQADTTDSEITIVPRFVVKDPFNKGGKIVLCDTYDKSGNALDTNSRANAVNIFNKYHNDDNYYTYKP